MNIIHLPLSVKRDWDWVTKRLPVVLTENTRGIIALDTDSQLPQGVVVLDGWTKTAVQAHVWVANPMVIRHGFLHEVYNYVFTTCGMSVMIGLVPGNHDKALKFDKHIGFKEKFRVKDGWEDGVDYVLLEMRKEDGLRWAKEDLHG